MRILCVHPQIALNAQNGMGLSPLLSAFKGHGEVEEESQSPVCTLEAAETLIRAGADVTMADATNGRTLVHMAVEKMAPGLVEVSDRGKGRGRNLSSDPDDKSPLLVLYIFL